MILGRFGDGERKLLRIVAENAEVGDLGAEARDEACEQIAIGIVKRGARQLRARLDDLVAGREQRDPYAPADFERGETERRRKRNVLHGETTAGGQCDRAGAHILTGQPTVGAEF